MTEGAGNGGSQGGEGGGGYEIRAYREGDEQGILASFNAVFGDVCGAGYVDRDLETWRWIYEHNPAGARIHVAIAPDGTVAGHYGGTPQRVRSPQGERTIVHAVDSFVVAAHRRGLARPGLFVNLAEPWFADVAARGDAMVWGYPVTRAMRIGQKYLGYTPMRRLDYLLREVGDVGVSPSDVTVEVCTTVPDAVDGLASRVMPAGALAVRRDHAYLDWRWARAPMRAERGYRMLAAYRAGELVGFAVCADALLVPDATALVDLLVAEDDADALAALVRATEAAARERGKAALMTVLPPWHGAARWLLGPGGFTARPSGDWLERTLSHRSFESAWTTEWLQEHWYYTVGDSDLA